MNFGRAVVFDTGVLISAAIRPHSVPALALERALLHCDLHGSRATLDELQRLLLRSKFDRYASLDMRQAFYDGLQEQIHVVEVMQEVIDCSDPKHNKFLALAATCRAEMIVASDPHLTQMHPWQSIPILPPAAFLVVA
jgi:uncharacterized protein